MSESSLCWSSRRRLLDTRHTRMCFTSDLTDAHASRTVSVKEATLTRKSENEKQKEGGVQYLAKRRIVYNNPGNLR